MPSENTGHGVRATQRTNALIRPGVAGSVLTRSPYRSRVTDLHLGNAPRNGCVAPAH
jgi:hypothetical protein